MWFPNSSDTNRPVQAQKQARSLKFWIYKVEELYYPCSENKDADQLRGYREADLRLCFRLCRLLVFPCRGSFIYFFFLLLLFNISVKNFSDRELIHLAQGHNLVPVSFEHSPVYHQTNTLTTRPTHHSIVC